MRICSILVVFGLLVSSAFGQVSLETTVSAGYNRDVRKNDHETFFINSKYNQQFENGIEIFSDIGLNNYTILDEWNVIPYQLFVTIPFDSGFENYPTYNSRVQLGRQLFAEGFNMELLDGIAANYYFRPYLGVYAYGGGVQYPEETDLDFEDRLYGGGIFTKLVGSIIRLGPMIKDHEGSKSYTANASFVKPFNDIFLAPIITLKTEVDLNGGSNEQNLAELQMFYSKLHARVAYQSVYPDPNLLPDRNYLYKLIAVDHQESISTSFNWGFNSFFDAEVSYERSDFDSKMGDESADFFVLGLGFHYDQMSIYPEITRIVSWGGDIWDLGVSFRYDITKDSYLRLRGNASKIDKVNGIDAWTWHSRAGYDFKISPRLRALVAAEIERNHYFKLDSRVVAYLTHFYF